MPPSPLTEPEPDPDPRAWVKIATEVQALITSGHLPPGHPAPTIAELSARHGVGRPTAAKALQALQHDGLLTRYPGHGYYATTAAHQPPAQEH